MKRLIVTLIASVLASASASGQGVIIFNNHVLDAGIDAPILKPDGVTGAGAGTPATAQLFLVTGSLRNPIYSPVFPAATFRPWPPAAQPYVYPPGEFGAISIPGKANGETVTLVLRAWEGPSYETASVFGQSNPIAVTLGFSDPISFPGLFGLRGFTMVPEPTVTVLGVLGAFAALLHRRRGTLIAHQKAGLLAQ